MTAIPVFGGPTKRALIQMAYEDCGQTGEFELDPEEYQSAERKLDQMMAELKAMHGVDLDYNFPVTGVSDNSTEESGIPGEAGPSVASMLAERIAPSIGKTLLQSKARASALAMLIAQYQKQPVMGFGRSTPTGAGNRYYQPRFFPVCLDPNEPV